MGGERAVAVKHVVFKVGGQAGASRWDGRGVAASCVWPHDCCAPPPSPPSPPAAAAAAGAAWLHRPPAGLYGLGRRRRVRVQPRIHGGLAPACSLSVSLRAAARSLTPTPLPPAWRCPYLSAGWHCGQPRQLPAELQPLRPDAAARGRAGQPQAGAWRSVILSGAVLFLLFAVPL